jgi:hypothetical protein
MTAIFPFLINAKEKEIVVIASDERSEERSNP